MATQDGNGSQQGSYLIAELCSEFAITPRALRFYEQRGLLKPARRGVTRHFSRGDRARLQLILRGKRFGFSLMEIKEILDLYDHRDGELVQLQAALPRLKGQLDHLRQKRDELNRAITDLEAYCRQVDDALQQRQQDGPATPAHRQRRIAE